MDHLRPKSSDGEKATAFGRVDGDALYANVGVVAKVGLVGAAVTVLFFPL